MRPPRMTRVRALALGVATLLATLAAAASDDAPLWYVVAIDGTPAGYVHQSIVSRGDGTRSTTTETRLVVTRMQARLEFGSLDTEDEDSDGQLKRVTSRIHSSRDETTLEVEVQRGQLVITTGAGGQSYRRVAAEPRPVLGPEGIRSRTLHWLQQPSGPLAYATFVSEQGAAVAVTRRLLGREDRAGRPALYVLEQQIEGQPRPSRLLLDDDARSVEESEDSALGRISTVRTTAAAALAASGAELRDELYAHTLLRANIRLPDPRRIERLRVRLELLHPADGWPALEGPSQRVIASSPTERVLEIRRAQPGRNPQPSPVAADPDLLPNVLLQSDHPAVAALAARLRRPGLGAFAQARVLQDWVATNLQFDAGLAVAPASEVVRDRRGTCVAYAVLTASLARALGIPARVVLGYVYVGNVFAGHAWTEVRVGHDWLPIDAAIYGAGTADAARIALVRHGGELGISTGAVQLAQLMGNVSITVEGYALDGHWVPVPPGSAPWSTHERHYRNRWLGLGIERPVGYEFVQLDAAYPDMTVLAMQGPADNLISVRQLPTGSTGSGARGELGELGYTRVDRLQMIAGHRAFSGQAVGSSALAFADGADLWLLEARGPDAQRQLAAVAASVTLRH